MKAPFESMMVDATQLTRAGKLQAAMATNKRPCAARLCPRRSTFASWTSKRARSTTNP
jgi:hypothetical protein